jgi:hypothetical protein
MRRCRRLPSEMDATCGAVAKRLCDDLQTYRRIILCHNQLWRSRRRRSQWYGNAYCAESVGAASGAIVLRSGLGQDRWHLRSTGRCALDPVSREFINLGSRTLIRPDGQQLKNPTSLSSTAITSECVEHASGVEQPRAVLGQEERRTKHSSFRGVPGSAWSTSHLRAH